MVSTLVVNHTSSPTPLHWLCLSTEDNVQYYRELASPSINSAFATHDVCSFAGSNVEVYRDGEIISFVKVMYYDAHGTKNTANFMKPADTL
jgi:hypothetical protein